MRVMKKHRVSVMSCTAYVFLFMCLPLIHCAYLNTYYNAKTAYNQARREHVKLLRGNVSDTALVLPAQTANLYERAVSKSLKVLEVYPKSKEWHDDAIYLMGRAAYYKGEFATAIRRLRRLQREFPESPYIPESYLYLGKAYLENDNLAKAEETFAFILQKYPRLNANEEVTLLMAEVAIKREGKAQAIELLEKTLASVRTPEKKMEILLKIARLNIDLRQWKKAIAVLEGAPRKKKAWELMYQVDCALVVCYGEIEDYSKALALAGQMLKNRHNSLHYPEIQLQKGRILKKAGKVNEAIDLFEQITKTTSSAPGLQGEAWFELALIYQHIRGDFKKAKECYEKALSLASGERIRAMAQMRNAALIELAAFRELVDNESAHGDTADTTADLLKTTAAVDSTMPLYMMHYKMGELFWLRLEEPDSALRHFSAISADTAADDTVLAQAIFARAWISLHMKQDSTTADSLFNLIIETCPASIFAKQAQEELGLPVTIKTRADSAHQAYTAAEKLYFDDGDALRASRAFLQVAYMYPDLDIGARGMYAAAWLCDNILQKNVTARRIYKTLCDSFPQSELCLKEAKPRLKVVEDTLAAIKMRKTTGADGVKEKGGKAGTVQEEGEISDIEPGEQVDTNLTETSSQAKIDSSALTSGSAGSAPGDVDSAGVRAQVHGQIRRPQPSDSAYPPRGSYPYRTAPDMRRYPSRGGMPPEKKKEME